MNLARRVWGSCLLITICMGSFGIAGLSLGFAVTLLISLASLEPALVKQRFSRLPLLLSAMLFLLWGLVTLAWSEAVSPLLALSDWSRWLILIPAAGFMMTDDVRHGIWRAFIAVQLIVAFWAIYVGIDCTVDWAPYPHAYECMNKRIPHGNIQATWMLAFAALLSLVWLEGRWRWVCAIALGLPLLMIGNRTGFLVFALGLAVAFWYAAALKAWRLPILAASGALTLAALMLNPALQARFADALDFDRYGAAQQAQAQQTSEGLRAVYWRASLIAIRDRPLIGHGIGSWSEVYRGLQPQVQGPANSANPHSSYLLIAVEQGLIGLFLFLGLLAALWQAAAWLTGFEAVAFRILLVSFIAGSVFNTWTHDGAASRLFLILMLLCLSGLRAPNQAKPESASASAEPQQRQPRPRRERRQGRIKP